MKPAVIGGDHRHDVLGHDPIATIRNQPGARLVSLRGSAIEQTIIRAYGLAP